MVAMRIEQYSMDDIPKVLADGNPGDGHRPVRAPLRRAQREEALCIREKGEPAEEARQFFNGEQLHVEARVDGAHGFEGLRVDGVLLDLRFHWGLFSNQGGLHKPGWSYLLSAAWALTRPLLKALVDAAEL